MKRPTKGKALGKDNNSQSSASLRKFGAGDQLSRNYGSVNASAKPPKAAGENLGKKNEHTVPQVRIAV